MVRYSWARFVVVVALGVGCSCFAVSSIESDGVVDQTEEGTPAPRKKREPKKRAPRKRAGKKQDLQQGTQQENISDSHPADVMPPVLQEVAIVPPSAATAKISDIPSGPVISVPLPGPAMEPDQPLPPHKFEGVVKRLCHPVKGKYFYLDARWKKSCSPDVVSYRLYVNGVCERVVPATKKFNFQVLRHTRHVRKRYEVAAVDAKGQESSRTALVMFTRAPKERVCACRIARFSIDLGQLTPEYLSTLSKKRIIEIIQQLRHEVVVAGEHKVYKSSEKS